MPHILSFIKSQHFSFLNLDKSVLTISEADAEGDSLASRETSYNTLNEAKDKLQKTIRVKFDQVRSHQCTVGRMTMKSTRRVLGHL